MNQKNNKKYTINIRVKGYPGWFRYKVDTKEQAMDHFAAITSTGYRRVNDRCNLEWFSPNMIEVIRITGDGLMSEYPDEVVRT